MPNTVHVVPTGHAGSPVVSHSCVLLPLQEAAQLEVKLKLPSPGMNAPQHTSVPGQLVAVQVNVSDPDSHAFWLAAQLNVGPASELSPPMQQMGVLPVHVSVPHAGPPSAPPPPAAPSDPADAPPEPLDPPELPNGPSPLDASGEPLPPPPIELPEPLSDELHAPRASPNRHAAGNLHWIIITTSFAQALTKGFPAKGPHRG